MQGNSRTAFAAGLFLAVSLTGIGVARGADELEPAAPARPVVVDGRVLFAVVAPPGRGISAEARALAIARRVEEAALDRAFGVPVVTARAEADGVSLMAGRAPADARPAVGRGADGALDGPLRRVREAPARAGDEGLPRRAPRHEPRALGRGRCPDRGPAGRGAGALLAALSPPEVARPARHEPPARGGGRGALRRDPGEPDAHGPGARPAGGERVRLARGERGRPGGVPRAVPADPRLRGRQPAPDPGAPRRHGARAGGQHPVARLRRRRDPGDPGPAAHPRRPSSTGSRRAATSWRASRPSGRAPRAGSSRSSSWPRPP